MRTLQLSKKSSAWSHVERMRWRVRFASNPFQTVTDIIHQRGPLVPFGDSWLVGSPELIDAVLRAPGNVTRERGQSVGERALWGSGIVVSEGSEWLHKRRLLEGTLDLERAARVIGEVCGAELPTWPNGRGLYENLRRLTLRFGLRTILGDDEVPDSDLDKIAVDLDAIQVMFANRVQWRVSWETRQKQDFRRAITRLDNLVYNRLQRCIDEGPNGSDMLSILVRRLEPSDEAGRSRIRDEIVTNLRAGHRNGSALLAWIVGLLAHHPSIAGRVADEVRSFGEPRVRPDLSRLTESGKVVREAMRLYPLYPILDRTLTAPMQLAGQTLPARSVLLLGIDANHRDAQYFPDPERFLPDRWTNGFERALPRGTYIPFGDGARLCPFKNYGMLEATLVTTELARRFEFSPSGLTRMTRRYNPNGLLPSPDFDVTTAVRAAAPSGDPSALQGARM